MKAKIPHRRRRIAVILTLAIPALIGSIAFGTDIAVLYMNWAQLRKSMNMAVVAGAVYLPSDPSRAISTARSYARICGIRNEEIVATLVGSDRRTISKTVTRRIRLIHSIPWLEAGKYRGEFNCDGTGDSDWKWLQGGSVERVAWGFRSRGGCVNSDLHNSAQ